MQVGTVDQSDTYAIIGGGRQERFSVGQSAHMINILSNAIYSNKELAVVREYLCNAVDAHRMNGNESRAVEVTIDSANDAIVFRDYGPGIADENMQEIFCVYGGTTKSTSNDQIGGFGLGCKAAFCYSDHFTVTSWHNGKKTIYALHKGGPDSDGMPVLQKMVSVSCGAETGFEVSVPVVSGDTKRRFAKYVRRLAFEGGFNVTLDGELLPTMDVAELNKHGFCIANDEFSEQSNTHNSKGHFFVHYGNVLYPISIRSIEREDSPALKTARLCYYHAIIAAPPNSISLAPSREALSYDKKTIDFLVCKIEKLGHFIEANLSAEITRCAASIAKNCISRAHLIEKIGRFNGNQKHFNGRLFGLDSIVKKLARIEVNTYYYDHPIWLKMASRYIRDDRKKYDKFSSPFIDLRNENKRYWIKRVMKIMRDHPKARIYGKSNGYLSLIRSTDIDYFKSTPDVIIAHSLQQARAWLADERQWKNISEKTDYPAIKNSFIVVDKTIRGEKLSDLIKRGHKFGVKISMTAPDLPNEEPKVVVAPNVNKWVTINYGNFGWRNQLSSLPPSAPSAPFYTQVSIDRHGYTFGAKWITDNIDFLSRHYPSVALSWTFTGFKKLKAEGSILLEEEFVRIAEEISSAPTDEDKFWNTVFIQDYHFQGASYVRSTRELACAYLNRPYVADAMLDYKFHIWRILGCLCLNNFNERSDEIVKTRRELLKRLHVASKAIGFEIIGKPNDVIDALLDVRGKTPSSKAEIEFAVGMLNLARSISDKYKGETCEAE